MRILYCLLDGHARTSTELAVVADVTPSTTSVHLNRLKSERLVKVLVQGKHRYYSLNGPDVAGAHNSVCGCGAFRVCLYRPHGDQTSTQRFLPEEAPTPTIIQSSPKT